MERNAANNTETLLWPIAYRDLPKRPRPLFPSVLFFTLNAVNRLKIVLILCCKPTCTCKAYYELIRNDLPGIFSFWVSEKCFPSWLNSWLHDRFSYAFEWIILYSFWGVKCTFMCWWCCSYSCSSLHWFTETPAQWMKYVWYYNTPQEIQWRHNERDDVSYHRRPNCLLKHLFKCRSKKAPKSTSLAFVRGTHRSPMDSIHEGPVTRKKFPSSSWYIRFTPFVPVKQPWRVCVFQ